MIDNEDVNLLQNSLRKATMQPILLLTLSVIFSRSRPKLFQRLKKYFYDRRPQSQRIKLMSEMNSKISAVNESYKPNSIEKEQIKIFNFKSTDNKQNAEIQDKYQTKILNEFDNRIEVGPSKVFISPSRKITSKRNMSSESADEVINLPRKEPTFREDFFTFGKSSRMKVGRLLYFKQFLNKKITKDSMNNRALGFLLNTKVVYLPFVIFSLITLFDFGYTSFGLYLKYQPLIDAYFIYHEQLNTKI